MPTVPATALGILTVAMFSYIMRHWFSAPSDSEIRYPPGPKGVFLLNNLLEMPRSMVWYTFSSWRKQYGNLIFLRILGKNILVVNSRKDATALFDKSSKIYSDRTHIPVVQMTGWGFNTATLGYTNRWRLHRKIYQQFLRPTMTPIFYPAQRAKIHAMLRDLLDSPEHFMEHHRTLSAAIIMKVLYDIDIAPSHDFYVEVAEKADGNIAKIALAGTVLPQLFSLIPYVPAWIPGLGQLRRLIDETRELTHTMLMAPFDTALKNPDSTSCVSMMLLEYYRKRGSNSAIEDAIREVCATAYAGGAETTVSSMATFFLAMIKYPEVQRKAHKELDEVLGNRLPEYEDRESLPYVEAIYREVTRWHPAVPFGLPRSNTMDDIYNGYFIPEGTIIFPNTWAMARDEEVYPNSKEFIPERFFNEDGRLNDDICGFAFGFGRRICPGRHMANATLWMTIASVLSVFSLEKAKDELGYEIPVPENYSDATVSHPEPFKCSITPRSKAAMQLVRETGM